MITVEKADQIIRKAVPSFKSQIISLKEARQRILFEDIKADRDYPPFDKALMDGIALRFNMFQKGCKKFVIEGIQAAGEEQKKSRIQNGCLEIMTGAVLPKGCDCIIPIEQVKIKNQNALIDNTANCKRKQWIRKKGSDRKKGSLLIKKGALLNSTIIATAASVGKSRIKVAKLISIAIVTSGDELIDIHRKPKPYQIRKSNSLFIQESLESTCLFKTKMFHLKDHFQNIKISIRKIIRQYDVLIVSGGVSMGRYDFIPRVLDELRVKKLFHKVCQRPGKPFWFGITQNNKPVFALPGNPASTQVCTMRYVLPALSYALGSKQSSSQHVVLKEQVGFSLSLTYFCPVRVSVSKKGVLEAFPSLYKGSGDFAGIAQSDGFIELPQNRNKFKIGFKTKYYPWN